MRERSDGDGVPSIGEEVRRRRFDLSVAQVAGSALAAVVAAKLASYFGVYGTILGAGVVSVLATCGGSVLQHFFRRTGEQLRGVGAAPGAFPAAFPAASPGTRPTASPAGSPVPVTAAAPAGRIPPPVGEFGEGTVYRARIKSWKRPVVAAALVFGVTMAGITSYELVSGDSFSGGRGTTVGYAVTGHRSPSVTPDEHAPTSSPSRTPGSGEGTSPDGAAPGRPDHGTGASPTPTPEATGDSGDSGGDTTGTAGTDGAGEGRPSDSGTTAPAPGASATAPAPSASSRSGTAAGDPAGPAAP
ncbi:hypothetical protein OIE49_26745 [Streptomyces sp. NBC_01788]|uniref:hypothetical protein n=1 Tax=Streptomyces sp. NBC_01788 TaxID=2975940 RepID=UPI002DD8FE55|nr:hypothetical protein [Streptomyces sp. NBC_01788]WSB29205.1 hypothetical protein OIE49_26745 [Streptomyces sp. NBC_01788]